jgi:hypothetical protein
MIFIVYHEEMTVTCSTQLFIPHVLSSKNLLTVNTYMKNILLILLIWPLVAVTQIVTWTGVAVSSTILFLMSLINRPLLYVLGYLNKKL